MSGRPRNVVIPTTLPSKMSNLARTDKDTQDLDSTDDDYDQRRIGITPQEQRQLSTSAAGSDDDDDDDDEDDDERSPSEYERLRAANVQRNEARLRALGLDRPIGALAGAAPSAAGPETRSFGEDRSDDSADEDFNEADFEEHAQADDSEEESADESQAGYLTEEEDESGGSNSSDTTGTGAGTGTATGAGADADAGTTGTGNGNNGWSDTEDYRSLFPPAQLTNNDAADFPSTLAGLQDAFASLQVESDQLDSALDVAGVPHEPTNGGSVYREAFFGSTDGAANADADAVLEQLGRAASELADETAALDNELHDAEESWRMYYDEEYSWFGSTSDEDGEDDDQGWYYDSEAEDSQLGQNNDAAGEHAAGLKPIQREGGVVTVLDSISIRGIPIRTIACLPLQGAQKLVKDVNGEAHCTKDAIASHVNANLKSPTSLAYPILLPTINGVYQGPTLAPPPGLGTDRTEGVRKLRDSVENTLVFKNECVNCGFRQLERRMDLLSAYHQLFPGDRLSVIQDIFDANLNSADVSLQQRYEYFLSNPHSYLYTMEGTNDKSSDGIVVTPSPSAPAPFANYGHFNDCGVMNGGTLMYYTVAVKKVAGANGMAETTVLGESIGK